MSRSGYADDCDDNLASGRWRGVVASSIRGKRGQAFLREMLAVLNAMPDKRLIANDLEAEGQVCAIGSVGRARGIDMSTIDPEDYDKVAATFGIAAPLAQEIVWMNDEGFYSVFDAELSKYRRITPEERFTRMREWVEKQLRPIE